MLTIFLSKCFEAEWIFINGSSNKGGGGARVVLEGPGNL